MIRRIILLAGILHCIHALSQLPPEQGSDLFRENVQANWKFSAADSNRWMKATVPGCVHTDLMQNRIIPDPLIGTNEAGCQWVG
ncbi:MAG: glycosyl hydrolase 2 galactose-binding domain-containing protein, partial [Flavobacteriales bacterium]